MRNRNLKNSPIMISIENISFLTKWQDGFMLNDSASFHHLSHTLKLNDLFNFPFNVFILNKENEILKINNSAIQTCGFVSEKDAIGRTIFDVAKKETANKITAVYKSFLASGKNKINEEDYWRLDDFNFSTITIKFPLYNEVNKKVGLLGFSLLNGIKTDYTISEALTLLAENKLLNFSTWPSSSKNFENLNFTAREKSIALLLVRGKTAKAISQELYLSVRTVENYIASMKCKLNVRSKSELVEWLVEYLV